MNQLELTILLNITERRAQNTQQNIQYIKDLRYKKKRKKKDDISEGETDENLYTYTQTEPTEHERNGWTRQPKNKHYW